MQIPTVKFVKHLCTSKSNCWATLFGFSVIQWDMIHGKKQHCRTSDTNQYSMEMC